MAETQSREPPSHDLQHSPDGEAELAQARHLNDLNLKRRFEDIFARYSKDFTDVGDIIDMETGKIVVDNGHLSTMAHEQDLGDGQSGSNILVEYAGLSVPQSSGLLSLVEEEDIDTSGNPARGSEVDAEDSWSDDSEDELAPPESVSVHKTTTSSIKRVPSGHVLPSPVSQGLQETFIPTVPIDPSIPQPTAGLSQIVAPSFNPTVEGAENFASATPQIPNIAALEALGQQITHNIAQFLQVWKGVTQPNVDPVWSAPPLPKVSKPVESPSIRTISQPSKRHVPFSPSVWATPTMARRPKLKERRLSSKARAIRQDKDDELLVEPDPENATESIEETEHLVLQTDDTHNTEPDVGHTSDPGPQNETNTSTEPYTANTKRRLSSFSKTKTGHRSSKEDDELMIHLREDRGMKWRNMQEQHFPSWTMSKLTKRYYTSLKRRHREENQIPSVRPSRVYQHVTVEIPAMKPSMASKNKSTEGVHPSEDSVVSSHSPDLPKPASKKRKRNSSPCPREKVPREPEVASMQEHAQQDNQSPSEADPLEQGPSEQRPLEPEIVPVEPDSQPDVQDAVPESPDPFNEEQPVPISSSFDAEPPILPPIEDPLDVYDIPDIVESIEMPPPLTPASRLPRMRQPKVPKTPLTTIRKHNSKSPDQISGRASSRFSNPSESSGRSWKKSKRGSLLSESGHYGFLEKPSPSVVRTEKRTASSRLIQRRHSPDMDESSEDELQW